MVLATTDNEYEGSFKEVISLYGKSPPGNMVRDYTKFNLGVIKDIYDLEELQRRNRITTVETVGSQPVDDEGLAEASKKELEDELAKKSVEATMGDEEEIACDEKEQKLQAARRKHGEKCVADNLILQTHLTHKGDWQAWISSSGFLKDRHKKEGNTGWLYPPGADEEPKISGKMSPWTTSSSGDTSHLRMVMEAQQAQTHESTKCTGRDIWFVPNEKSSAVSKCIVLGKQKQNI